jgi:hypothetical protein
VVEDGVAWLKGVLLAVTFEQVAAHRAESPSTN